jgi:hypothetical protein
MIENVGRTDTKIGNAGRDRLSRAEPSREIARRGAGPLSISVSGSLTRIPSGDVAVRCRACGAVRSSTGRGGILTGSSPGDLYVRCMGRHSGGCGRRPGLSGPPSWRAHTAAPVRLDVPVARVARRSGEEESGLLDGRHGPTTVHSGAPDGGGDRANRPTDLPGQNICAGSPLPATRLAILAGR